ncbi:unnamed protein product [Coregonus sp. 'balchen']|nr:unnamed protein product [Coregonus sp. 'balchen']
MSVNLSDYFKSYFGENLRDQLLKATSAADEMLAPSSRLLQKRREAMEVNKAMTLQREDFESTLRALRIRKDELIEKEGQMKEYLQKFDNFLKENEVKRCRAVRKASRERELTNQKQVDLVTLQEETKALVKERDRLEKRVQKNAIYPHYLDKVVQASEQESRWAHIQNTAAKKTLLLGTIKMATLNLYQCVCKRAKDTGESPVAPEDTIKQLEKIQTFLADLISIWEEVNKPDQPGPTGHR